VSTVIFRTFAPFLAVLMVLFSIFVLLRGHNEPGGGFIAGLIAASALAIYGIANGVAPVRRALYVHPMGYAGVGVVLATLSGLLSLPAGAPFLTGLWGPEFKAVGIALSTPFLFDIGVYLTVMGAIVSIALGLEERDR